MLSLMRSATPLICLLLTTALVQAQTPADPQRDPGDDARVADVTQPTDDFTAAEPFEVNQGGAGSVRRKTDLQAFSLPQDNLGFEGQRDFAVGNGLFERIWVTAPASTIASDGLGPMFNTRSCQDCHIKDGRGHAPAGPDDAADSLVVRLGIPSANPDTAALERYLAVGPDPTYGHQFSDASIAGVAAEGRVRVDWDDAGFVALSGGGAVSLRRPVWSLDDLAYGAMDPGTRISARVAPPMIGLGLLEAIPADDILSWADPDDSDNDGISGRANMVWSPEFQQAMLGRFGVRATTPTLRQQAADAFNADIGIASPLRPDPAGDCTLDQVVCRTAPDGIGAAQDGFEVSAAALDLVTFYTANLAVPRRRDVDDPKVLRGKEVFYGSGCTACHRPKYVTGRIDDRPEDSFQLIWPYSDLLLHDMGPGLADDLPAGQASGSEWRTAPLWGIGLTRQVSPEAGFLHDGRARTLSEAIVWHGGEAQASRDTFVNLTQEDRDALLTYLESL